MKAKFKSTTFIITTTGNNQRYLTLAAVGLIVLQESAFIVTMFSIRLPHWKGRKWGKRAV